MNGRLTPARRGLLLLAVGIPFAAVGAGIGPAHVSKDGLSLAGVLGCLGLVGRGTQLVSARWHRLRRVAAALDTDPGEWEARVIGFLEDARLEP